jgi:hypothetical protein
MAEPGGSSEPQIALPAANRPILCPAGHSAAGTLVFTGGVPPVSDGYQHPNRAGHESHRSGLVSEDPDGLAEQGDVGGDRFWVDGTL